MNAFRSAQIAYDSMLPTDLPEDGADIVLAYDREEIAERIGDFIEANYEIALEAWMGSRSAEQLGKDLAFYTWEQGKADYWLTLELCKQQGRLWKAFEAQFAPIEQARLDFQEDDHEPAF
jgi:hypothetical protein